MTYMYCVMSAPAALYRNPVHTNNRTLKRLLLSNRTKTDSVSFYKSVNTKVIMV